MTAGAIPHRETRDLFVLVFHPGPTVLVAPRAGVVGERRGMACAAVAARSAVIHRKGVRPIERGWTPGAGGVTGPAAAAKGVSMRGRVAMTGRAGARRALERAATVAALAARAPMGARQREGRQVVVERPVRPGRRAVAGGAIGAGFAIVPVVLDVTTDARRRRADVPPAWVTRAAGRLGGGAGQREAGPAGGEGGGLPTPRQGA